jgi:hypothetical protein
MSNRPFSGVEADRERNSKWRAARLHGIAVCGEFVGTTMFLWFSFAGAQTAYETGGVANTSSQVMLTSLSFGFALLVTVWAFYRISGGLFNPAVGVTPNDESSQEVATLDPQQWTDVSNAGYSRNGPHRQSSLAARPVAASRPIVGRHCGRCLGEMHVSRPLGHWHNIE